MGSVRHAPHSTHVQGVDRCGLYECIEALTANLKGNAIKDNLNCRRPTDDETPSFIRAGGGGREGAEGGMGW